VGSFIVDQLARLTQATIYCLVRASGAAEAQSRLVKHLQKNKIWRSEYASRVIAVPGDLAQPNLGFSPEKYEELAQKIDAIYHAGAWVNFILPYETLKPANVLGTQEILRLATHARPVPVHHFSTLSVLNPKSFPAGQPISEQAVLLGGEDIEGGYAQSKWVADKMVDQARLRGIPVTILRFGTIVGHSQTGVWDPNLFVCRLIKGCVQLGFYPEIQLPWQLLPVNILSHIIVQLSLKPVSIGKTFHIESHHLIRLSQIMTWVGELGYHLQPLPVNLWLNELVRVSEGSPDQALYPLVPLLLNQQSALEGNALNIESHNLQAVLDASNQGIHKQIEFPQIDAQMIYKFVEYLIDIGFLTPPRDDQAGSKL
jgi:thioester reductase-like protein